MNKRTISQDGRIFERIDKKQARKLYNNMKPIYILPCKIRFDLLGYWYGPYKAEKGGYNAIGTSTGFDTIIPYADFDKTVNCYEYYNCNSETGKYSAFYREV